MGSGFPGGDGKPAFLVDGWGLAADAFEAGGGVGAFEAGLELVVGAGVLVSAVVPPAIVHSDAAGYRVAEVPAIGAGVGFDAGLQVIDPVVEPSLAGADDDVDPVSERGLRVGFGVWHATVGCAGGQVVGQSVLENGGQGMAFPGVGVGLSFPVGELKDAFRGDAGDASFAVSQPALLPGGEAAEAALALGTFILGAVAVVVGVVIDLAFGPSVGLVKAAVEGFAAVGGEGFEDAGSEFVVGVGYGGIGLPVGAVPRGEAGGFGGVNVERMCGRSSTDWARVKAGSARPLVWLKAAVRARRVMRERVAARRSLGMVVAPWGAGLDLG